MKLVYVQHTFIALDTSRKSFSMLFVRSAHTNIFHYNNVLSCTAGATQHAYQMTSQLPWPTHSDLFLTKHGGICVKMNLPVSMASNNYLLCTYLSRIYQELRTSRRHQSFKVDSRPELQTVFQFLLFMVNLGLTILHRNVNFNFTTKCLSPNAVVFCHSFLLRSLLFPWL